MVRKTLKSVDVLSLANVMGLLYLVLGFLYGILLLLDNYVNLAIWDFTVLPIAIISLGLSGWVGGILCGWIYNIVASRIGGVKFNLN
ncbi:hypothetical protein CMI41_02875 [Candidatus Pacearchaeota archaeon]|jgi:hypothetical protein|nr:hypothetical protein [Candidatus Pacearchaeota archaeon]|tara:strand:+ start:7785 stop:8045 length:261 start_codon:yes stop_codon:yes gene_type:complete